jgi:hypothetical protein
MIWTARTESVKATEIAVDQFASSPPQLGEAENKQLAAAADAAAGIASSGAAGDPDGSFFVSVSGSPGDEQTSPTLSLTVTRV